MVEREARERELLLHCVTKLVDDATGDGELWAAVVGAFRDADLQGRISEEDGGDAAAGG